MVRSTTTAQASTKPTTKPSRMFLALLGLNGFSGTRAEDIRVGSSVFIFSEMYFAPTSAYSFAIAAASSGSGFVTVISSIRVSLVLVTDSILAISV